MSGIQSLLKYRFNKKESDKLNLSQDTPPSQNGSSPGMKNPILHDLASIVLTKKIDNWAKVQ